MSGLSEGPVDFEEYVAARGQALVRFAFVLTGDAHRAEDLTQAALADACRRWRRVSRMDYPDAYVRRMIVNANGSWWRRLSSRETPVESVPDGPGRVSDPADDVAARDQGRWLLESLAPRARTVLVLRYYADLDDAAIADVMGISVSGVRATASRALASLRERLPGEASVPDIAAKAAAVHARTEELR